MAQDPRWQNWERLGSPRYVCAPMVLQSERAFRVTVRRRGVDMCFTPMVHADLFLKSFTDPSTVAHDAYSHFANVCHDVKPWPPQKSESTTVGHVVKCEHDRPLILQFCSSSIDEFVAACTLAEAVLGTHIDGIDLNLGCPQKSADRGGFGVFLAMRHPERATALLSAAIQRVKLPVSAKIRVWDDVDRTVDFARSLAAAGVSFITVHGRTATQRHHSGRVRVDTIAAIAAALPELPIVGNGGITSRADAEGMIAGTKCAAVMAATGLLVDINLFDEATKGPLDPFVQCAHYMSVARDYPPPTIRFIRDHLHEHFGWIKPQHPDLYSMLSRNQAMRSHRQFAELMRLVEHRLTGDASNTMSDGLLTLRQIKDLDKDTEEQEEGVGVYF